MPKTYFDIVVVIPLEEELIEFFEVFPSTENLSTETQLRHAVSTGSNDLRVLVVQQSDMGKNNAQSTVGALLDEYHAGLVICLGIAGGLSPDIKLGDVCYSRTVIDVYDNAKVVDRKGGGTDTHLSPTYYETDTTIVTAISFIRTQPALRSKYLEWQQERHVYAQRLCTDAKLTENGKLSVSSKPSTLCGVIACGSVSKSGTYNDKLRGLERKILAIDTESGGIFAKGKERRVHSLTIRGISDYADADKGRLEVESGGLIRKLAAANAASFLRLQFENPSFVTLVKGFRNKNQQELAFSEPKKNSPDILVATIERVEADIDESLRKLSPEYRLQPKGYRLPLPRVRSAERDDGTDDLDLQAPIEATEAIKQHERVILKIPRTYPDQGLSWILADDLLTSDLEGKQVIPVVIDASLIKGHSKDFKAAVTIPLDDVYELEGVQVIFIVENLPLESKHRLSLIASEIDRYPRARCVFVIRGEGNLTAEAEFQPKVGALQYDVCPISFLEIAHFIQKNFSMSGSEAEVVALRLRDTFSKYDLDAHPTYFAGIPKEALTALLQANRRSELIQLAVDGFLTFLVAGDRQDITLSRSTRARFLRKLAVELRVEKRCFDQAQLVAYTQEFAALHDFDIKPIAFIQAFVDQGILHFENDRVRISLPFIEYYLLASELASDPRNALKYFDLSDPQFDFATFDLYSEIGASVEVVQSIHQSLLLLSETLNRQSGEQHILLTEKLSPSNIRKPERASALKKRLKNAADAVKKGVNNPREKQKFIDLSERIREETVKQRRREYDENVHEGDADAQKLSDATRRWAIATVLLGSGAEHLDAQTKRALSAAIIKTATLIIDEWSRFQQKIDFQVLKKQFLSTDFLDMLPGEHSEDEKKEFVSAIVDILEYAALAEPLRRVVGYLCEQARHRVLATSVENATIDGIVEKIIHGTWLADIDSSRGIPTLKDAIRDLPSATFFRITLASHYLARVYWNHWQVGDRMALLEAAEEVIKPLSLSVNKGEIKRLVSRQLKENSPRKRVKKKRQPRG